MKTTFIHASTHKGKVGEDYYVDIVEKIRINKILNLVGKNKKVLDVGCYDGSIGEKLLERGNEVYGLDASQEMINLAKKKGVKGVVGNLEEKFPFDSGFFDTIVAGEVLEHILDTGFFIDEIRRILKLSGELILTTPNVCSLGRRIMTLFGMNAYFEASFEFPSNSVGHIRFYTKNSLKDFLIFKGFKIVFFESDVVKFPRGFSSKLLADIFPTLGRDLIFKAKKLNNTLMT